MIRDARANDCEQLSELAFASKAHWGYDEAFMEACRAELTVQPADLDRFRVRVADDGAIVGFHGVECRADGAEPWTAQRGSHSYGELNWLFVAPVAMERGVGAALFADACAVARAAGVARLRIEADPFAAGFYERMGATRAGEVPSASIPGRILPLYSIDLSSPL